MFIQMRGYCILFMLLALSLFGLIGCVGSGTTTPSVSTPKGTQAATISGDTTTATTIPGKATVATPPQAGDIPDTQTFVKYHSTQGGYEVEVPEGWAQSTTATGILFTNAYNSVQISFLKRKVL